MPNSSHVRVAMLGEHGIGWPWVSLHVETLAWYDQWLKGRDTGVLDGPPIRYQPGRGRRVADLLVVAAPGHRIPRAGAARRRHAGRRREAPGQRAYMSLGAGLNRAQPSQADPPSSLTWDTSPLAEDLDVAGNLELRLDATASASDTAWIVVLQDVAPDGTGQNVTAGYLRASLRAVDEKASQPGSVSLLCRSPEIVPVNEATRTLSDPEP